MMNVVRFIWLLATAYLACPGAGARQPRMGWGIRDLDHKIDPKHSKTINIQSSDYLVSPSIQTLALGNTEPTSEEIHVDEAPATALPGSPTPSPMASPNPPTELRVAWPPWVVHQQSMGALRDCRFPGYDFNT